MNLFITLFEVPEMKPLYKGFPVIREMCEITNKSGDLNGVFQSNWNAPFCNPLFTFSRA
jgi:hypothetical protein